MKKRYIPFLILLIQFFVITSLSAQVVTNFSDNLTNALRFKRPNIDAAGNDLPPWPAQANYFNYAVQNIEITVAGNYTFETNSLQVIDPMLILYTINFDPNQPTENGVVANDDIIATVQRQSRILNFHLNPGFYTLVLTVWNDVSGLVNYTATGPALVLVSPIRMANPNALEVLNANNVYKLKWSTQGIFDIKLEYSADSGKSWNPIIDKISSANLNYDWTVPQVNSDKCIVKATKLSNTSSFSLSPTFTIFTPFEFLAGNGGESWPVSSQQTISWTMNIEPYDVPAGALSEKYKRYKTLAKGAAAPFVLVSLDYSLDGGASWVNFANNIRSYHDQVNTYTLSLPSTVTNLGLFRVTVTGDLDAENDLPPNEENDISLMRGVSTSFWSLFRLATIGKFIITSPNGGEKLVPGSYSYITWKKTGGITQGALLLEYSTNYGQTWTKINTTPIAGITRYSWKVPQVVSSQCMVRVSNYLSRQEYDRSDRVFQIMSPESQASNYPNPFNPATKIVFNLEKSELTSLKVFNSIGQEVAVLVNKQLESGAHEFEFNAANLPSGVYFYSLTRGDKSEIHKMLLLK